MKEGSMRQVNPLLAGCLVLFAGAPAAATPVPILPENATYSYQFGGPPITYGTVLNSLGGIFPGGSYSDVQIYPAAPVMLSNAPVSTRN
jgi:hypothetical protein